MLSLFILQETNPKMISVLDTQINKYLCLQDRQKNPNERIERSISYIHTNNFKLTETEWRLETNIIFSYESNFFGEFIF